jgi:4-hydroxy-3-methylbut-2-enyl diphosphate reductase
VEAVERALKLHGLPVYVRDEIVHGRHVVAILWGRGVFFVKNTDDEVQPSAVMMFSARGVSPAVRVATKERAASYRCHLPFSHEGAQHTNLVVRTRRWAPSS